VRNASVLSDVANLDYPYYFAIIVSHLLFFEFVCQRLLRCARRQVANCSATFIQTFELHNPFIFYLVSILYIIPCMYI